jgi:hypothetical protein
MLDVYIEINVCLTTWLILMLDVSVDVKLLLDVSVDVKLLLDVSVDFNVGCVY